MDNISTRVRSLASTIIKSSDITHWKTLCCDKYGLSTVFDTGVQDQLPIMRQICLILRPIPPEIVKNCGIVNLYIRGDMGPNKPYYPNHGYFHDQLIALNADIFIHPDSPDNFSDERGYSISRPQHTLIHELGHGFDTYNKNAFNKDASTDLSLQPEWLKLSGWKEESAPGLKRIVIEDKRAPKIVGEWFYDPRADFVRFYAKRNPWDDWADSFAYYFSTLRNKVPAPKKAYFDRLFRPF